MLSGATVSSAFQPALPEEEPRWLQDTHLGKCTPCPLNGFLLAALYTAFVEAGETRRDVLVGTWKIITGHHISESRTFQMSSRTIGAQDNHFLHLWSRKESLPSRKMVVNSLELAGAMLTACHEHRIPLADNSWMSIQQNEKGFYEIPSNARRFCTPGLNFQQGQKKPQQEQISPDSLSFSR